MKRLIGLLLMVVGLFIFTGCPAKDPVATATVERTETMVVITITEEEGSPTLLQVMEFLREEGKLSFTADVSGMVTSIEGKQNAADWSACWMLYTSDEVNTNTQWGTIEYNGKTYGSAMLGADALCVEVGDVYVWSYQTF